MCARRRRGGRETMTRGREGWALVHQIERRGWWGDTLPGDGGPGARGGLSIFQHAPLHE